ncbi:MAG: terpene cyclase/mutase family protein, partial [Phycisphaerae bacterium]|nr:terpene cyclase/mutase family protein [Phycisphaerae bacterium]
MTQRLLILLLLALAALLAAPRARLAADPGDIAADDPTTPELEARIDAATDKALAYLASIQRPDGSWLTQQGKDNWQPTGYEVAAGSLAIMAFQAKGHQPGEEPYGPNLEKGIDFIISKQAPNGFIAGSGQMYAHGISTLMLAEVVGHTTGKQNKRVKDALAKAVKLILDAQKVPKQPNYKGGWRYQPTAVDSDLSITAWQLMALRAAKNAGADVPFEAINDAVDYVKRSAAPDGGFGYTPGGRTTPALAGAGIVSLELCGKHNTKEALAAGDWLLKNPAKPYGANHQYYTMYYCSQAMFQLGDRYWKQFWPAFATEVLKRQQADGSFPLGAAGERTAGPA